MTVPCVHVSLEIHKAWPTQPGTHPVLVCVCVCLKITERERWERQSQRTVCIHQFQASIAFHLHPTGSIHNITFYIVFVAPASYLTASGHIKIVSQSRGRHFFMHILSWSDIVYLHFIFCGNDEAVTPHLFHSLLLWGPSCGLGIMGLCFRDNQTSPPNADTKITDWII